MVEDTLKTRLSARRPPNELIEQNILKSTTDDGLIQVFLIKFISSINLMV